MENNLPKLATSLDDDDDKSNNGANIEEIESSDTEIEPDNIWIKKLLSKTYVYFTHNISTITFIAQEKIIIIYQLEMHNFSIKVTSTHTH